MTNSFSRLLLLWYRDSARVLPWRGRSDAYGVWVSEIMLQQTRIDTVLPYYERWMARFPSVQRLAGAEEQEVLALWEGLGYYARARNMLKTARIVRDEFGGVFPVTVEALRSLPGIGRYSAAAISSIVSGADEAVLDGNVKRVLARYLLYEEPVDTPVGEKHLWQVAQAMLPKGEAADYNQAVMDLGALVCTPRSPACGVCPVKSGCQAFAMGRQAEYPLKKPKPVVPHYEVCAAVLLRGTQVLIALRPAKGLLGGLWEFPGGKLEDGESQQQALARELIEELGIRVKVGERLGSYRHAYTHFRVSLQAWFAEVHEGDPSALHASEVRWVRMDQLGDFPMGKIDRMISRDLRAYFSD